jgi:hypothetical protein
LPHLWILAYLLYWWHIYLDIQEELTEDEKELLMNLSEIVEQRQQDIRLEERRCFVENMLKIRFGNIDESLSPVIDPLLKLTPEESSRLIWQASRDTLLIKLSY